MLAICNPTHVQMAQKEKGNMFTYIKEDESVLAVCSSCNLYWDLSSEWDAANLDFHCCKGNN